MPRNVLYSPIIKGNLAKVIQLINAGASVNDPNPLPLHVAVIEEQQEIVDTLLQSGAKVNEADKEGNTSLHLAAGNSNPEILSKLISYGADLEARDKYQNTPLLIAANTDRLDAIDALLVAGANVNAANAAGVIPLDVASPGAKERLARQAAGLTSTARTSYADNERSRRTETEPPARS